GQLERLAVPDPALLGDAGGPQGLAADQGGGGLVLVLAGLGGQVDKGVLDVRGVDGEDDVYLAAEFLGDARGDGHGAPVAGGQAGVVEVGGADAEDDLLADVAGQA